MRSFVDTHIHVYADSADVPAKQSRATALIAQLLREGSGVISTQVLHEFVSAGIRKLALPLEIVPALSLSSPLPGPPRSLETSFDCMPSLHKAALVPRRRYFRRWKRVRGNFKFTHASGKGCPSSVNGKCAAGWPGRTRCATRFKPTRSGFCGYGTPARSAESRAGTALDAGRIGGTLRCHPAAHQRSVAWPDVAVLDQCAGQHRHRAGQAGELRARDGVVNYLPQPSKPAATLGQQRSCTSTGEPISKKAPVQAAGTGGRVGWRRPQGQSASQEVAKGKT